MTVTLIRLDGAIVGVAGDQAGQGVDALAWFHRNCRAYSMAHAVEHEGYSTEDVEEIDCRKVADILEAICKRERVTMETTFIPFSQSRHAKPGEDGKIWQSLNWKIELKRDGRTFLETEYSQGEAHAPAYKSKRFANEGKHVRKRAVTLECETGKIAHIWLGGQSPYATGTPVPAPALGDVVHSLAREADVLEAGGFEAWCSDLGMNTDSRKAEAMWKACLEIALKLRGALGDSVLAELRLVSQFN